MYAHVCSCMRMYVHVCSCTCMLARFNALVLHVGNSTKGSSAKCCMRDASEIYKCTCLEAVCLGKERTLLSLHQSCQTVKQTEAYIHPFNRPGNWKTIEFIRGAPPPSHDIMSPTTNSILSSIELNSAIFTQLSGRNSQRVFCFCLLSPTPFSLLNSSAIVAIEMLR